MCGRALSSWPAPDAARSIIRAKPAVVKGEPRSLTNTKGDDGLTRDVRAFAKGRLVCISRSRPAIEDYAH
jgi:hypothetical protein